MLSFKKVLLGETDDKFDIRKQTEWPELGGNAKKMTKNSISQVSANVTVNLKCNIETGRVTVIGNEPYSVTNMPSCSTELQAKDFPQLTEMKCDELKKQLKTLSVSNQPSNTIRQMSANVKKSNKLKKVPSKAPLSIDMNVMLKLSLSLANQKRLKKSKNLAKKCTLSLYEQLNAKSGNELDSDCPVRYKGKKRPLKRRKKSKIKQNFHLAADTKTSFTGKNGTCMYRLRQLIQTGVGKGEPVDDLVTSLSSLHLANVDEDGMQVDCMETAMSMVHSKKFRQYCNHLLNSEMKRKSKEFITTLRTFQDRWYAKDALCRKLKRRYLTGLRESKKYLRAEYVKLLFIASDLPVGKDLPAILKEVIILCESQRVPIIFSASLSDLRFWTLRKHSISVLAVLNYDGAEKLFKELLEDLEQAKQNYSDLIKKVATFFELKFRGESDVIKETELFQDVEQQIRDNIISKLNASSEYQS